MKLLLIGHPGSGKTFIADALAAQTGVAKIDLDDLFDWHPANFLFTRPYQAALRKLLGDRTDWIADGYHGKRMPDWLWQSATHIVIIDLPKAELRRNVLVRYRDKRQRKESSHGQATLINTIKNFAQISFRHSSLTANTKRVKAVNPAASYVVLRSRQDIEAFIDRLAIEDK